MYSLDVIWINVTFHVYWEVRSTSGSFRFLSLPPCQGRQYLSWGDYVYVYIHTPKNVNKSVLYFMVHVYVTQTYVRVCTTTHALHIRYTRRILPAVYTHYKNVWSHTLCYPIQAHVQVNGSWLSVNTFFCKSTRDGICLS